MFLPSCSKLLRRFALTLPFDLPYLTLGTTTTTNVVFDLGGHRDEFDDDAYDNLAKTHAADKRGSFYVRNIASAGLGTIDTPQPTSTRGLFEHIGNHGAAMDGKRIRRPCERKPGNRDSLNAIDQRDPGVAS